MPIAIDRHDLGRRGGIFLLAAVVLAAILWGGWTLIRGRSPADAALADVRRLPLIGLVMADNPGVEGRMRQAIAEELRSPTRAGLSRPFSLVADLRRQYIVPALRAADDDSVLAAVDARADFVRYLRRADTAACRQFALGALRPDLLEDEGRQLFGEFLRALEAAYRNGKTSGKPQRRLTRDEVAAALKQAGFTKADFDRLQAFQTLSNEVSCDVELKVDAAPGALPAETRGALARYVLTN